MRQEVRGELRDHADSLCLHQPAVGQGDARDHAGAAGACRRRLVPRRLLPNPGALRGRVRVRGGDRVWRVFWEGSSLEVGDTQGTGPRK